MTKRTVLLLATLVAISFAVAATAAGWTWDEDLLGTLLTQFGW